MATTVPPAEAGSQPLACMIRSARLQQSALDSMERDIRDSEARAENEKDIQEFESRWRREIPADIRIALEGQAFGHCDFFKESIPGPEGPYDGVAYRFIHEREFYITQGRASDCSWRLHMDSPAYPREYEFTGVPKERDGELSTHDIVEAVSRNILLTIDKALEQYKKDAEHVAEQEERKQQRGTPAVLVESVRRADLPERVAEITTLGYRIEQIHFHDNNGTVVARLLPWWRRLF